MMGTGMCKGMGVIHCWEHTVTGTSSYGGRTLFRDILSSGRSVLCEGRDCYMERRNIVP